MRTLVIGLLLSTAAWAQTELTMLASAETTTPDISVSGAISVSPILKPTGVARPQEQLEKRAENIRTWYVLAAASHGAAGFDAWTTRNAIRAGGRELNPLLEPFADSNALYPVLQVGPAVTDYVALKMMRSNRPILRKLWWVPQLASTAISVTCGIKNMR